jgi:pimeloyl-ACP methyl ester carboxylesterase
MDQASSPDPTRRAAAPTLVALHSSGAGAQQWARYPALLPPHWQWRMPDLLGYDSPLAWPLGCPTSLDAEAGRLGPLLDAAPGVHLVGHSYGATVALQLALRWPQRVRSLTLYEPVRFALLRDDAPALWHEIVQAGRHIGALALAGRLDASAEAFVDYWSGAGTWQALPPKRQVAVRLRMPKVQAEFEALFGDALRLADLRRLTMPLRIVSGTRSPAPAQRVAELIADACASADWVRLDGAGHMEPVLQPERFARLLLPATTERCWAAAA